jgi:hypothetical protein
VLWRNQKTDPETEERAREKGKQFCQLKPLFQLRKAAFFFVIPLVISADIRAQKMGGGVVSEGGEISPSSGKFQKPFTWFWYFNTLIKSYLILNNYWIINKQLLLFPSPTRTACVGIYLCSIAPTLL